MNKTRLSRSILPIFLCAAVPALTGCEALYFTFGPGGLWPADSGSSTAKDGATATTQPATVTGFGFTTRQLDPKLEATAGARVVVAADMNGDGFLDFVSGSAESQPIQLHLRDPNSEDYTTITIAGGAPISTMYDLAVADFDGDGRPDIAVLVNDTGYVPVSQSAKKRGAVVLLFNPQDTADPLSWQSVTITCTFLLPGDDTGLTEFAVADIDGQGGPDIVLASNEITSQANSVTKYVYLLRNPTGAAARSGNNWASTTVWADVPSVKSVKIADIDGDGDLDIGVTYPSAKSQNISWLKNPLLESGLAAVQAGNWVDLTIGEQRELQQPGDTQVPGADFLALGDIDGDGAIDAVVAHQSLGVIQWFRNPGTSIVGQVNYPWEVYTIGMTANAAQINQLQLVDMDQNGLLQVFITGSGNMAAFKRGLNVQDYWQPYTITGTSPAATIGKCAFADINGDGLLDIVAPLDREGITDDEFLIIQRITP